MKFRSDFAKKLFDTVNSDDNQAISKLKAILTALSNEKVSIDAQDEQGFTALIYAAFNGKRKMVHELIKAKANLDIRERIYDQTALLLACRNKGYLDIVSELIDAKANMDLQDAAGNTALMLATYQGYLDIVNKLIESKADPNIKNRVGDTALFLAANNGQRKIVHKLLEVKAELNIQGQDVMGDYIAPLQATGPKLFRPDEVDLKLHKPEDAKTNKPKKLN
ncbi:MAG: ankyrin repeat domain-containing protein [Gammaproteobacteria bacterium]